MADETQYVPGDIFEFQGTIQLRRGTASQWTTKNPILADGEIGLESDTRKFKIGNGTATWTTLAYGGLVGPQGVKGDKGDTGDVTPALLQALADAQAASEEAINSAGMAFDSATDAVTAKTAAETAKTAAQTAQVAAEGASTTASAAATSATNSATAADASKTAAASSAANAASTLASAVLKSGSVMTGPLTLAANPAQNLEAAPKQYVDTLGVGLPEVRKLNFYSGGDTTFSFGAYYVALIDSTFRRKIKAQPSVSGNISTAGPVANGRDQAAAFPVNSEVHFYFIWNPTTDVVASLASLSVLNPTLPAGFTHFCYATTVKMSGSNLLAVLGQGSYMYFHTNNRALAGGASTTPVEVSCTAWIPTNATAMKLVAILSAAFGSSGAVIASVWPRDAAASVAAASSVIPTSPLSGNGASMMVLPIYNNVPAIKYSISVGPTSGGLYIDLVGYTVANGDS